MIDGDDVESTDVEQSALHHECHAWRQQHLLLLGDGGVLRDVHAQVGADLEQRADGALGLCVRERGVVGGKVSGVVGGTVGEKARAGG